MNTENQIAKNDDENPFKDMGFIKFWVVSTVFWFSFPVSLVLCCLALGSVKTKQFVKALVHDFLQTLFIILVVVCVITYTVYHYIFGLFYDTSNFLSTFSGWRWVYLNNCSTSLCPDMKAASGTDITISKNLETTLYLKSWNLKSMIIWIGWNGLALEIFHHKELGSALNTRLFFLAFCCHITLFIKVAVFIYKKNPYHE